MPSVMQERLNSLQSTTTRAVRFGRRAQNPEKPRRRLRIEHQARKATKA